jgi:hypothetical protein
MSCIHVFTCKQTKHTHATLKKTLKGDELSPKTKKKNPTYKNQGWEPIHKKYKANESTRRHNPKKK